jgi:hypothetical protein
MRVGGVLVELAATVHGGQVSRARAVRPSRCGLLCDDVFWLGGCALLIDRARRRFGRGRLRRESVLWREVRSSGSGSAWQPR